MEELKDNLLINMALLTQSVFKILPNNFNSQQVIASGSLRLTVLIKKKHDIIQFKCVVNGGDYIYTAYCKEGQNILETEIKKEYFSDGIYSTRKLFELINDPHCGFLVMY